MKYIVWGPDEIPIRQKPFPTREAAERGIADFTSRFKIQGYYAGVGFRLPLGDIAAKCRIEVANDEE